MKRQMIFGQRAYCNCASDARWQRRHPSKNPEQREHRNFGSDCELGKPGYISPMRDKIETYKHCTL